MCHVSQRPGLTGILLATALVAAGCGDSATEPVAADPTPPVLSGSATNLLRVRDFVPFGLAAATTTSSWEFITTGLNHQVRATTAGEVVRVLANTQGGYQVHVRPTPGSIWTVIYDHVGNLEVDEGDKVSAGTVLGTVTARTPTTGRLKLKLIAAGDPDLAHCPANFGTEAFKAAHDAVLQMIGSPHESVCLSDTATP